MAIYHYHSGFISRSTGRSAVQSVAYLTGTKLEETRRNLTADYRNRSSDIAAIETLAPIHALAYMRTLEVWNVIESYEDKYAALRYRTEAAQEKYKSCAQTAQTAVVALPKELTPEVWKELVTDFVQERFISRGLVVTYAIHNDEGNPHAHLQISRRSVTQDGQWSWTKDREIVTKTSLIETRKLWAEKVNFYLEREGFEERIDHRSYAEIGLLFEPTQHEGWYSQKLEQRGKISRIVEENQEIKARNKETLILQPEAVLKELTLKQATFSSLDLAMVVQKRLSDDPKLASYVIEASLSQAVLVGMSLDDQARYTSQDYLQLEYQALNNVQSLMDKTSKLSIAPELIEAILKNDYAHATLEQKQAIEKLSTGGLCHVLIGRAGSGKTTTLKAMVALHQQAGFKVIGLSLAATAADNLGREANCTAETIAFYLDKWKRLEQANQDFWSLHPSSEHHSIEHRVQALKPYELNDKHLVIVDEAGMLGTAQWQAILKQVQKAGAKLIAVGDDHQFKAIEAGDFFRKFKEMAENHHSLYELNQIFRQKDEWMKASTQNLSELKTYQALSDYEQKGHVVKTDTEDYQAVALAYLEHRSQHPGETSLLLASTRVQCQSLNDEIRKSLKDQGVLDSTEINVNGRSFTVGDKIVFLKNDRDKNIQSFNPETGQSKDFLVKNGTYGEISNIREIKTSSNEKNLTSTPLPTFHQLTVAIDKETQVHFTTQQYNQIDHGYAVTLHKAQGQTVDWAMVLASKNMDAYATYVALTRHRNKVTLFYDAKTFGGFKGLQQSLSRISNKDLSIDYTISPEHQGVWENVQEYKLLGQDLATTARKQDWEVYNVLKAERTALGQIILSDWQAHWHYVRQAGLSQEAIQIASGLKPRPLSLAEQQAHSRVKDYAHKAFEARTLWREIRHTHPGKYCHEHPNYEIFTKLRQERNSLAEEIVQNRPLYREFIQELGRDLGIGWKVLQSQATQGREFEPDKVPTKTQKENIFSHAEYGTQTTGYRAQSHNYQQAFVRVEAHQIKQELNERIGLLAKDLLGEPQSKTAREWRYGSKGSTAICIAGAKQGLYADFETGSYGGGLKLIQDKLSLDHKEAYKWAINWLGHSSFEKQDIKKTEIYKSMLEPKSWIPTFPIPEQAQSSLQMQSCLDYQLSQGRHEIARYAYKNADGCLLGYTVRLEDTQGNKVVLPLTYCQGINGQRQWRWQGFSEERPLYGLDRLAAFPQKPILIVEGEKTADAAQTLLSDYVVVSWPGGASSYQKADWAPIVGRNITLWPDNDKAGLKAMANLEEHLIKLHQTHNLEPKIQVVQLPKDSPAKWDLADSLPTKWTEKTIRTLLQSKPALPSYEPQNQFIQEVLQKYGLEKPSQLSDAMLMQKAQGLYQQMQDWHQFLKTSPSADEHKRLFEKAILAQILQFDVKREYCFLCTPFETKLRSEGIALVTAGLMQQSNEDFSKKLFLQEGARIFDDQNEKQAKALIKNYKPLYPETSPRQLALLADQHLQCWNMIKSNLTPEAREILLTYMGSFEALEQSKIQPAVQKILEQQPQGSSLTKENEQTLGKVLEGQFMEMARHEKLSGTQSQPLKGVDLNVEALFEKSLASTKQIQATLAQERLLTKNLKELEPTKDTEKER